MERSPTERSQTIQRPQAPTGSSRRFAAYSIAAVVAVLGTAALAVILLGSDSAGSGANDAGSPSQETAFAFFDEFHATLIVTPASTGENTVDLSLTTHDGSGAPNVSGVTVTAALPGAGGEPREYPAEPVAGSPGTYELLVSLPRPGEWELTVSVVGVGSESAIVPIGAR